MKRAITGDLQTRYQENEIFMLLNKASLPDPQLKSLVILNEEVQTSTIDSLVNEILTTYSLHAPTINEELVVLDNLEQSSSSHQTSEKSGSIPTHTKILIDWNIIIVLLITIDNYELLKIDI